VTSPHNHDAEQSILGILMQTAQRAGECGISPADLNPVYGHDAILAALLNVAEEKGTADPVLLMQELAARDQLNRVGTPDDRGAGYLHTLVRAGYNGANLPHYVQLVRAATTRRRVHEYGTRLVQVATSIADMDNALDHVADVAVALQMLADHPVGGDAPIPGLSLVKDFVDEPSPPYSWVIPGLIEHADRVMLVAGEGTGKSVLSRQVGLLLAAGRHPFSAKTLIPPKRVLLFDLENPPALVRRKMRGIVGQIYDEGLDLGDRAWRWNMPGGLDLRSTTGRALFSRAIEQTRPDLICVGPLYKMSLGKAGDSYEIAAAETAAAIDSIRERYGCAFWIEHHVGKGEGGNRPQSPLGSSFWMRWPEFGLVLKRDPDAEPNVFLLDRFRGDRDERPWPERLVKAAGKWPWTADYHPATALEMARAVHEESE